ncbi:GNAT family N-acetyltransferase [Bacillus pseudomycoides]|uniref:GNAT family N-acetyltransferase n=1 Tax=Bacillus pseudomycoides TaxID=64104 RepID=A0A2B6RI41_9BACI|nr:GNAT family N-acetyltransferase [Bacillus pseudomycoides]PEA82276.1 GNAT family N-acetyltransferase [Bacillus pseudomycoides]PED06272.1 GNAT family N-acetyltransferase [Bacillus pseudomycoides]PEI98275.1 GNAT family N-acetyltransferase [Bacillus pseudomycoides]PEK28485.1 GNAT family N-acetyltransferase [Bacillus pseudomycoides]PEM69617.1 GNAT family N-acetyltransferase [Bacillus pseudomycoides]
MNVKEIKSEDQLDAVLPVLQQLRTALTKEEAQFLFRQMKEERYQLFSLCNDADEVVSLAGVAVCTNFYNKKHVFVYDLVTVGAHRSKGYGKALLSYIEEWGVEKGCSSVVLTSAFPRVDAHRFYEREGYDKVSYSFHKKLK